MAAEYFLYHTGYSNTLMERSNTSFAPFPPDTGEIYIDYFIPNIQTLYLYRESGGTIIHNSQETIENFVHDIISPPTPYDYLYLNIFTGYTGVTAPMTYVNVSGDTMTGSLYTTNNLTAGGLVSGSSVCGGVWIHSPIVCANTCLEAGTVCSIGIVKGTILTGSTCTASPIICGTSYVQTPTMLASICACSPITCGSTCVISPITIGTSCVCSPIVLGSTCVDTPISRVSSCLCSIGTTMLSGATTLANTLSVSGVTRLGTTTCLVSTPAVGSISADRTLFWNPTDKCVKAIRLTGGSDNYFYSERTTQLSTTQTTCQLYIGYCPTTFIGGKYQVDFDAAVKNSATNRCSLVAFKIDGVTQGINFIQYGVSISSPYISKDITLTAGTHCFDVYYWSQAGTTTIYYANVRVKRIG